MLTSRQIPVLNLTETNITSQADLQNTHLTHFVYVPMVEKTPLKTKIQCEQLSDSDTPDEEADP